MEERKFGLGVVLYIFNQELSKVLLLKLNDKKRDKFSADWGNVGGKVIPGEKSLEAILREAQEETGFILKKEDLKLLDTKEIPHYFGNIHAVQFVYGAKIDERTPIILGNELTGYQWTRLEELPDRTLDSREDYYRARRLMV